MGGQSLRIREQHVEGARGMTPTVLGRLRAWRIRRTKRKLAGLRAELTATQGLVKLCFGEVPGALVIEMRSIPREIAELEELLKQLGQD